MTIFFEKISEMVSKKHNYTINTINEIIHHIQEIGKLRQPQINAIKTYLYLRYETDCKTFSDLLKYFYKDDYKSLSKHLGLRVQSDSELDVRLYEIKNNNIFNGKKYDTLHEALNINYPNYILALAMGSGKTYLIASIIAIEFAIALDNKNDINNAKFIKNALVFAPGLTIKEQLKRIVNMDYSWVLPERLRRKFLSNITFHTEANINTVMDCFNIVITNT
jgi:hypothetical protein